MLNHQNAGCDDPANFTIDYLVGRCEVRENVFMSNRGGGSERSYDGLGDHIVKGSMNLMDFIGIH